MKKSITSTEKIIEYLRKIAPEQYQEEWDNSGYQVRIKNETEKVILCMDVTDKVIDHAVETGAKLIISHHPMIFTGIKIIDEDSYLGKNIIKLIENKISVYSSHTSLDVSDKGVNVALAEALGLPIVENFAMTDSTTIGYVLENNIGDEIYERLNALGAIFYGKKVPVERIAIVGGSGMSYFDEVVSRGLNMYITGDVKHHDGQRAYEENISLVDLTHYGSEKFVLDKLKELLEEKFTIDVEIIDTNFKFYI